MSNSLIEIRNLSVTFPSEAGTVQAVRDISLDIRAGEVLGIVGESGSGKTVTSLAAIGLLPDSATISGSVMFNGVNLLSLNDEQMSKHRGNEIAMIFQDPLSALNPVHTIGRQIAEALLIHKDVSTEAAHKRAIELLEIVGISATSRTCAVVSTRIFWWYASARDDCFSNCQRTKSFACRRADNGA
jgi:ABC-type microcin C transport system duplicated ATPase subunit YejF